ncbi:Restriction endonuclease [Pseudobutyrivibrio ruminis]|uniref:Restriction endonuclease n=1 Tax=Pseudobutyrivibrio ruminis TaxID=46206 RepID=A0A1H7GA43_9FIRM|nr:restriction endonuclease [Pseudobutyrivibrio ruminis]SEK33692.1 Restriction endonuclease [Pseudobutyrivibrio ruminis]
MGINYKSLDFCELDTSGDDFELLVREILYNEGYEVYWSGKGPDGGKDLICVEKYNSIFKEGRKRWLIQCKHNAHSGNAVSNNDLGNITNSCKANNADGYILVCSTYPSSTAVKTLENIELYDKISTSFWDYQTLEGKLLNPRNWSLVSRFFPKSAEKMNIQISQISSDCWRIYYKGSIVVLSLRIASNCNNYIPFLKDRVDEMLDIPLPEGHYFKIRAIYYDDKYCNYRIYYDYLIPSGCDLDKLTVSEKVKEICSERWFEGIYSIPDVVLYECNYYSDGFDINDKDYYSRFMQDYQCGFDREFANRWGRIIHKDSPFGYTEDNVNKCYNSFIETFKKIPSITVYNSHNSSVESIGKYSDNSLWMEEDENRLCPNNPFEVKIRFSCDDFDELINCINYFPVEPIGEIFSIEKNYVFLPDTGFDSDENDIYTLRIQVNRDNKTKASYRRHLNSYLDKLTGCINTYLTERVSG